jgi:L-ascorbate metabolism protein UlaG (beta-lactamase superfamily)
MVFTWLGGPTFVLRLGAFAVLADPVFGEGKGKYSRLIPPAEPRLDEVDGVFVSRFAEDHCDAAALDRIPPGTTAIAPPSAVVPLTAIGYADVRGLAWWEDLRLQKGGEVLEAAAVPANAALADSEGGSSAVGNGYVLRHTAAGVTTTVYWTGDSVWSNNLREIPLRFGHVNLLILHLGAEIAPLSGLRISADARDAMQFVFRMQPRTIIPVHHSTHAHYTEPIDAFRSRIDVTLYERRLAMLTVGQVFEK